MPLIQLLDYASVLIFALTGALVASRAQLDLIGFAFFACLTGMGGGTLRDILLDRNPIFWIGNPTYLAVACAAALLVFFTAHLLESRYRAILWLDALALGVSVSAGAAIAAALDHHPAIIVLMGTATGCAGGLARDVVANEIPLVLKKGELYVTCALAGALVFVGVDLLALSVGLTALACASCTFILRAGSLIFGWSLPTYKPRPPRR